MNGNVMNMLSQEADSYQSFMDRGKQSMDNYDIEKVTHDGLDQAYKSGKNMAAEFAREAVGERTVGYIEAGIGAAPMVGKAYSGISSQLKAEQAENTYRNMTGKTLKQGLQQRRMQQAKAKQQPKEEDEPAKEDPEEARTATEDDDDLQTRLDNLRRDPEPDEDNPISGESSADAGLDEYGLPQVQPTTAADDAVTEAGFPKPPAEAAPAEAAPAEAAPAEAAPAEAAPLSEDPRMIQAQKRVQQMREEGKEIPDSAEDPLTDPRMLRAQQRVKDIQASNDPRMVQAQKRVQQMREEGKEIPDSAEDPLTDPRMLRAQQRVKDIQASKAAKADAPDELPTDQLQATKAPAPDEVPTETEGLLGKPGYRGLGDEGFGQGAAAPPRGGEYTVRGGSKELDTASLRSKRLAQPDFDEDLNLQVPKSTTTVKTSADQYGERPTSGGMDDAIAERKARFAQIDQDAGEKAAKDALSRAEAPTRGTEFGEDIDEGPTEIAGPKGQGQQDTEFDDDYMPEDEETRLARKAANERVPLEDQGVENPIGPQAGEGQAPADERLGTFDEEAQKSGVEPDATPDASLPKPQAGSETPKVDPAPEETADLGIGAEEDAALTEGLVTAEAAESTLPGLGEGLMALTAIGGILYSAFDKPKVDNSPAPVALPPAPTIANTAFASAPLIDSNQFHSL